MFKFFSSKIEDIKQKVSKTAQALVGNLSDIVNNENELSEFLLEDIEDILISADLGANYAAEIVDDIKRKNIKPTDVKNYLKDNFLNTLKICGQNEINYKSDELNIYFITGVNGVGKTTLIGKLAYLFSQKGKRVLIAAADTFRAAAEEQVDIWSKRAGAQIVRRDKADPASVVYEAIDKAKKENFDVILVDTAGRLHNKFNLMEELTKIKNVINKNAPESLRESILVIDANTGQNGLSQAKVFKDCVNLTSIAVTKLDGSAKGAIVISIAKEFSLPVKLVGVGEKMEDLKTFNPIEFIEAIFE